MASSQELNNKLENILTRTISCIKESRDQLFEVAETSRREIDSIESELSVARQEVSELSAEIEQGFDSMSRSGQDVSREEFAVSRIRKEKTQQKINQLVKKIKVMEKVNQRAESLVSRMGVVNDFLQGRMINISERLENLSSREDFIYQIIETQERERKRVAREIHDGPAQSLANLILRVEIAQKLMENDREQAFRELEELKKLVKSSVTDVRKIIYALHPMSLEELGLLPALRRYVDKFTEETGVMMDFNVLGEIEKLPSGYEVTIFRLIQEGLNNIKKHAEASSGKVELEFNSQNIRILISDNGQGFEISEKKESRYGLSSMKERCSLLQGELEINSNPGQGTRIAIRLPVKYRG